MMSSTLSQIAPRFTAALSKGLLGSAALIAVAGISLGATAFSATTAAAQTQAAATAEGSKPVVRRYVVDQADMISEDAELRITQALAKLHRQQDAQVVVVTVDDLRGRDINDFASQLGQHWGVAVNEAEPGMMMIVAPKEQKVKLHVGPGLEAWMPEEMTRHIIANYMFPSFSQRNYEDGVVNGAAGVIAILGQDSPVGPKLKANGEAEDAQIVRSSFTGNNTAVAGTQAQARDFARRQAAAENGAQPRVEGNVFAQDGAGDRSGLPVWMFILLPLLVLVGAGGVLGAQRFAANKSTGSTDDSGVLSVSGIAKA